MVPVNDGGVWSAVHVTDLDVVALLPQPSTAVNVLTCVTVQPYSCRCCISEVRLVIAPQASVAVAVPRAAVISVAKDYIRELLENKFL